jgi:glycosyltransferase involved in cell wall biosynthesis
MTRFSVVIPAFNRERELPRAVSSCLAQEYPSLEVIVVDDGSNDATVQSVSGFPDPRLRVIRHTVNRGQGAARNTGVRSAKGDWVVSLDSDDELLPDALATLHRHILRFGDTVERLAFSFERDDGRISPLPLSPDETLDYAAYVAWLENRELWDFLPCARRSTFDAVQWAERHWADHCLYNLDFAARFRTHFCSAAVAHVHTDAAARMSYRRRTAVVARATAVELGEYMDCILQRHGAALRQFAPRTFGMFLRMRAAYHFLAGERRRGFCESVAGLRAAPFSVESWGMPLIGLSGPRLFAALRAWRPPAT